MSLAHILAPAAAGLVAGLAHAFGPDHMAALATLSVQKPNPDGDTDVLAGPGRGTRKRTRQAIATGLRFGIGHGASLASLALVCGVLGYMVPPTVETVAEVGGGALLFILGAATFLRRQEGGMVVHRHAHSHTHGHDGHSHWHLHWPGMQPESANRHKHRPHRGHLHSPFAVGGLLALSGVRGLLLSLPPFLAAAHGKESAVLFVVCFSIGVAGAMSVAGWLLRVFLGRLVDNPYANADANPAIRARDLRARKAERLGYLLERWVAGATAVVGVAWMWIHWPHSP